MLWLDTNANEVLKPYAEKVLRRSVKWIQNRLTEKGIQEQIVFPPIEVPPVAIKYKTWEYPVMDKKFMIGFVDMWVQASIAQYFLTDLDRIKVGYSDGSIAFEVKPKITSLGELFRQLNMYRTYIGNYTEICVVCPDDRFAEMIRTQGFMFAKYMK